MSWTLGFSSLWQQESPTLSTIEMEGQNSPVPLSVLRPEDAPTCVLGFPKKMDSIGLTQDS